MPNYADLLALPDASDKLVGMREYLKSTAQAESYFKKLERKAERVESEGGVAEIEVAREPAAELASTPSHHPQPHHCQLPVYEDSLTARECDGNAQVEAHNQTLEAIEAVILGEAEDKSIVGFSRNNRKMVNIRTRGYSYGELLQDFGSPVFERVQEKSPKDGDSGDGENIPFPSVLHSIQFIGGRRRLPPTCLLGAGCWAGKDHSKHPDGSVVIVGAREALRWDGITETLYAVEDPRCDGLVLDFSADDPWFKAPTLCKYMELAADPNWCRSTITEAMGLFRQWSWKNRKTSPSLLVGLILASWIQTLWGWRPHVAIAGASGAGKSTLFSTISEIFGGLGELIDQPTAPGLRQTLQQSAKVVMIDEFEKFRGRDEILKMVRSSSRGGKQTLGSQDQKRSKTYIFRHMIWVASINSGLRDAADRNRFILLEIKPFEATDQVTIPQESELHDLGQRLAAIAIRHAPAAVPLAKQIKKITHRDIAARVIESYAAPASIISSALGKPQDEAEQLLRDLLADVSPLDKMSDEEDVLSAIFDSLLDIGRSERYPIGRILETVINNQSWGNLTTSELAEHLNKVGLKVGTFGKTADNGLSGQPCLVVNHFAVLNHVLRNTDWQGQTIDQILVRIPRATREQRYVGGRKGRFPCIPLDYVTETLLSDGEGDVSDEDEEEREVMIF